MSVGPGPVVPQIVGLDFRRRVGSGGYADVYLYHDPNLGREVAVKVMRSEELADEEVASFLAEARAMAALEHPHIVPIYGVGESAEGRPYLTMPYYPQGTLFEHARRPLPVPEVLQTGVHIGSAVAFAHEKGVLHRDIKPHNVLRNPYGAALSDFGIAATIADLDTRSPGVSVPWSPPELLFDTVPASPASDVYALAATLWHLLTARAPFEVPGEAERELVQRIAHQPLGALERLDVPPSLDRLLRQSMAKNPSERIASAQAFVRELQHVERELGLPPTPLVTGRIAPADHGAPGQTRRKQLRAVGSPPPEPPPPVAEPPAHQTILRPPEPVEEPSAADDPGPRVPVVLLLMVLVMLVVLILGVVVLVWRHETAGAVGSPSVVVGSSSLTAGRTPPAAGGPA